MPIGDRSTPVTRGRSRRRLVAGIAAVAAIATVVTLAVTAQGYQAQEVPRLEQSVWVLRDSGQYARVNTELAEIDTVRDVEAPDAVWQSGADTAVFTQGSRQRWDIDPSNPQELVSEDATAIAAAPTPEGTRDVVSAGPYVAYRTETGQVAVSTLDAGSAVALVDPFADEKATDDEDAPTYAADAIGLSPEGVLALYSAEEQAVRRFDVDEHRFLDSQNVGSAPEEGSELAMTVVGDRWALFDVVEGLVWLAGGDDPVALDLADEAVLQRGAAAGDEVLIADTSGLLALPFGGGDPRRVVEAAGSPAAPVVVDGQVLSAWVDTGSGVLRVDDETVPIEVPSDLLEAGAIRPVFRENGDRAVLTEVGTGLIWTAPEGTLVPLEQWSVEQETVQQEGTVVEDVTEQLPPVAVNDAFGVRSGQQVVLPILLNDHDPNRKDVLTVDPASIAGGLADPDFGELSLVADGQSLVVTVRASSGRTTFTYAVTDGSASSAPATVTLNVVDSSVNSAPVWCGVDACQQEWPTPQVLPGGNTIVSALGGWVDPEGDALVLSDAYETDPDSPIMVVPMSDGRLAVRHTDPNAPDALISVTVVVVDARGAESKKTMEIRATKSPELLAAPVAVTVGAGESHSIPVFDYLTGGSGSYRLVDAVPTLASTDGLDTTADTGSGAIDLKVAEPGQYVVTYTAQDAVTQVEKSAIVRVTAVDGSTPLAMAPLTAFVREGEDTTVDVLRAVQNTSGRVLIVSDVTSSTPQLSAAVVGNESIRVSGTTKDGEPGVLGAATVTVADGAGAAVTGTVTVFLTPMSTVTRPIVFPDAVTVRAGTLARVPVTANDIAPRGEPLVVLPEVIGSGEPDELVFADGNTLRYLAPSTPGTYRLTYSVSLERTPSLADTGAVTVTVLAPGTNRPPTPPDLEGRVLSGQTVSIPVPTVGIDVDGDPVVLTDIEQPSKGQGTVTVAPDGQALVYRAPDGGVQGGQARFRYSVRDPEGGEGTGIVRVGVLNAEVDEAAPVTFSDYLRARAGSTTPVVLDPRLNDLDPAQGELELIELVPNAPTADGNPLYRRLDSLIDGSTSLKDGRVVLRVGDVEGTNSYIYTVRSTRTGSTAQGLIVLSVNEEDTEDPPRVQDTVVTARDRATLAESGIDVVTDRVRWASGDVDALTLSLWGEQPGFTVEGNRIIGDAPAAGAVIPFQLTAAGREVVGYGFLHIPSFEDLHVQRAPDAEPVLVDEDDTQQFDVGEYVDLPASEGFNVGGSLTVQRAAAECTASGTSAEYAAGSGAPWSDTCLVPVRLKGQQRWSYIEVPITVRPVAPQLNLSSLSRTIAPGTAASVDLYTDMASWEGGREGDPRGVQYRVLYSGSAFLVTQDGATVSVEAKADASPGTRESVTVRADTEGAPSASLHLVVGVAPPDAPRGATFTQQCTVTTNGCSIDVVDIQGEYDPFAGKQGAGLTLVSLGAGARCDVASLSPSGNRAVSVSWPGRSAPGGQCIVPFVVADAQGRTGTGTLTLDLQGLPSPPASVSTVGYTRSTVELEVALGEATRAYPAVSSVSILQDGSPAAASCSPAGGSVSRCTVTGLVNGAPHAFTAVATNAVGSSAATSAHTSWAYAAPAVSAASAVPVYRAGITNASRGVASLSISAADDASSFRIEETGEVIARTGATTTADVVLPPGPQTITIVPVSQFQPPTEGADNEGGAYRVTTTVAGGPYFAPASAQATAASNTSITVSGIAAQMNSSDKQSQIIYLAWRSGTPQCTASADGTLAVSGAEAQSASPTIAGLSPYTAYNVKACVSNGYGVAESSTASAFTFTFVGGPSGDTTYTVATSPTRTGDQYSYGLASGPAVDVQAGFVPQYRMYGSWRGDFQLSPDSSPGQVQVRACHSVQSGSCSGVVAVTATTAPTIVDVTFRECLPAQQNNVAFVSGAARGSYQLAVAPVTDDPESFAVTITWQGAYAMLSPITHTVPECT